MKSVLFYRLLKYLWISEEFSPSYSPLLYTLSCNPVLSLHGYMHIHTPFFKLFFKLL